MLVGTAFITVGADIVHTGYFSQLRERERDGDNDLPIIFNMCFNLIIIIFILKTMRCGRRSPLCRDVT